ncbi:MAG: sigma-70 family RNA polymerase sigma factor [Nitrospirales bacterium]|nr:sigma-70 family RNA polymerase sigma factor [Nitrospirales bacterium]
MPSPFSTSDFDDVTVIKGLQQGNEHIFEYVVNRYSGSLLRVALAFVPSRAVAEEVVQETWLGVFEGIGRFEGRSSFQTWLFRILSNRAKTRGVRESRYEPMGLGTAGEREDGPSLDDSLFVTEGSRAGHWKVPPADWEPDTPERALLSKECRETIEAAIAALPLTQRQVITLRDLEGMSSEDICNILDISETNQRVLLHRARTKVRQSLNHYLAQEKHLPS